MKYLISLVLLVFLSRVEANNKANSLNAFSHLYKVSQSRRCMNCHSPYEYPLNGEGEDFRPHTMNVKTKIQDLGQSCTTCHSSKQFYPYKGVPPAAPNWHMPDKDMALTRNISPKKVCEIWKDFDAEGAPKFEKLIHHVTHDPLVQWTWKPGGKRVPAPGTYKQFLKEFNRWIDEGAHCPES
jgi:hypothetical protein